MLCSVPLNLVLFCLKLHEIRRLLEVFNPLSPWLLSKWHWITWMPRHWFETFVISFLFCSPFPDVTCTKIFSLLTRLLKQQIQGATTNRIDPECLFFFSQSLLKDFKCFQPRLLMMKNYETFRKLWQVSSHLMEQFQHLTEWNLIFCYNFFFHRRSWGKTKIWKFRSYAISIILIFNRKQNQSEIVWITWLMAESIVIGIWSNLASVFVDCFWKWSFCWDCD